MAFTLAQLQEIEASLTVLQKHGFAAAIKAIQDGTAVTALTAAHILVGNSSNEGADVAVSGDLTLATTGAFTYTNKITRTLTPAAHAAAISVTNSGTMSFVIADAAETNTLAIPGYAGQILAFSVTSLAGSGTRAITSAQAINGTGNTVITLNTATDSIVLIGMNVGGASTLRWRVLMNDGCTLS